MKSERFSLAIDFGAKSCAAFCLGLSSALFIFSLLCKEEEKVIKALTIFAVCFAFVASAFFLLAAVNGFDAESKDALLKDKSKELRDLAGKLDKSEKDLLESCDQLFYLILSSLLVDNMLKTQNNSTSSKTSKPLTVKDGVGAAALIETLEKFIEQNSSSAQDGEIKLQLSNPSTKSSGSSAQQTSRIVLELNH